MKKIHIATSPLTGTIFAILMLKPGTFSEEKEDITNAAISAVADHILKNGGTVVMGSEDGAPAYEITVKQC